MSILPRVWTNWITLGGSIVTTVAGCTLVLAIAADVIAPAPKPYASAFIFLVAPVVFIAGLLAIPVGLYWERRRKKPRTGAWTALQEAFDTAFQAETVRRGFTFVGLATLVNIAIMGAAGHKALLFMDSVEFCGTTCHTVMQPEYTAYKRSPHQRVACVDCHIGSGASWAARAKISGLRQVWAVTTNSFNRPIPSPVHELRPARDTCEQCHWPAKFHGKRVHFRSHFEADEANTESINAVLLNVGGVEPKSGEYHGIHWHVSPDTRVEYDTLDPAREKIDKVRVIRNGEVIKEFNRPGDESGETHETRSMDCVDCHNRPTHIYDQSAADAVDRALHEGLLDKDIPYLAEASAALLADDAQPREGAAARYRKGLADWYSDNHDDVELTGVQLGESAEVLAGLYNANVFSEMNVGWGTYPTHIGHRGEENDVRGCFRCHDDEHESADGEVISQDCDLCHEVLHEEEAADSLPEALRAVMESER